MKMESKGRRLSDRIIDAFEMACAQHDLEAAESLYRTLEIVLTRQGGRDNPDKRADVEFVHEAARRLATLRDGQAA
jgi:hypothetical protein